MTDVKITGLSKNFGATEVLKAINLEVRSGEFIVFVGPSGCGKSTLLRCIAGLEKISVGSLEIGGRAMNDVPAAQRGIAMVFQTYALYPHMSVAQNMSYALRLAGMSKAEQSDCVGKAAQMLHLDQLLDRLPRALSGGQRQRVAIGRAIVREPGVFLFDEPLSNLDAALRLKMRLEIAKLHADLPGTTMIYVTHDQVEAMTMADRIVVLRDGMIEQVGTPMELYNRPASLFVAQFIGSPKMNVLTGALAAPFGAAHVGIRPEHLELRDGGPWRGRVLHSENLGADSFLYIDLGLEDPLAIRQSGPATAQIGSEIAVAPVDNRLVHRFDDHGLPLAA